MIIGVTASRDGLTHRQQQTLKSILGVKGVVSELHHGMCKGGDQWIHEYIRNSYGYNVKIVGHPGVSNYGSRSTRMKESKMPPDVIWSEFPFLTRNQHIVNCSEYLIACPKTEEEVLRSGTWTTVRKARKKGIPIIVITPGGEILDGGRKI